MGGNIKPIGGEQWFTLGLFDKNIDNFSSTDGVFLSGGQSALRFILEDLCINSEELILMPSYLCHTILYPIREKGIKYDFYKINKDLSIDLVDLQKKVQTFKPKAVFIIDYFGFNQNEATIKFLTDLKKTGITIIEDGVQMLWFKADGFIGDYVFNSYRKFLPIDGSLVIGAKKIHIVPPNSETEDEYSNLVNEARMLKTSYMNFNIGKEEEYLKLYSLAEEKYYKANRPLLIKENSKKLLSMIDIKYIREKRLKNYKFIFKELQDNKGIHILFNEKALSDNIPLGLPIFIQNRDTVRKKLMAERIYCPVHWNLETEGYIYDNFDTSRYISEHILTIPIDQRYDFDDMKRITDTLKNELKL
jgi:dTDP-4-amino-4,6-dideoxygalactose transaminase